MTDERRRRWTERWDEGSIPWHVDDVHPVLREHEGDAWERVLAPLCGASVDLAWLAERGHEVVGVEFSRVAARRVFQEAGLRPELRSHGSFDLLTADRLTVVVGDFFEMTPTVVGTFDAVWDRAALVAVAPDNRESYLGVLTGLAPAAELLLVTLDYPQHAMEGPPHAIPDASVRGWFDEVSCFAEERLEELADELEADPAVVLRRVYRARVPG